MGLWLVLTLSLLLEGCSTHNVTDPSARFEQTSARVSSFQFEAPVVKKDLQKLALTHEYAPAMNLLANLYMSGEIKDDSKNNKGLTPKKKAFHLYRMASLKGIGSAQFNVGIFYKNGLDIPKDAPKAYFWLLVASHNVKDLGELTKDAHRFAQEAAQGLSIDEKHNIQSEAAAFNPLQRLSTDDKDLLNKICYH